MNINVTKEQLSWLINGIEVEMEAIKSTLKDWPIDSTDKVELEANYKEQEVLLKMLRQMWPEPTSIETLTEKQFNTVKMINEVKQDCDWALGWTYEHYVKVKTELFNPDRSHVLVCNVDPSHDVSIWVRGNWTEDAKTGDVTDWNADDEVHTCDVCKGQSQVISESEIEEFEGLVEVNDKCGHCGKKARKEEFGQIDQLCKECGKMIHPDCILEDCKEAK